MNGSEILINVLLEQNITTVFGYPGGQVVNIYDALYKYSDKITHVLTAHEQGAAHAADGYARASGKCGVVIATSGPGATNLVTGIANAYLDSVPLVAITGNVPNFLIGRDSFQEVDIAGITMPIVKHGFIVKTVEELADTLREAFRIAISGRPGPVLVDIPKDVQTANTEYSPLKAVKRCKSSEPSEKLVNRAARLIQKSKKPFIYCGGGAITSGAEKEIAELSEIIDAPIGTSMMGLTAVSSDNPNMLGMTGMHGRFAATKAKGSADLIIALGARFSDRAINSRFQMNKKTKIIHIDIDNAEIDKNVASDIGINADVCETLKMLIPLLDKKSNSEWRSEISKLQKEEKNFESENLYPRRIINCIRKYTDNCTPIVTDVGQHQMWTAQYYKFKEPRTFISSGGLGAMGFGMGGAIGASTATGRKTVLITGDGSFGMDMNELATVGTYNIPVIIIIMNNGALGMVRQMQTMFFDGHYSQTTLNRKTDFVKLADAFGIKSERVNSENELETVIKKAFMHGGPFVIDCPIDMNDRVLPMIPPNGTFDDLIVK